MLHGMIVATTAVKVTPATEYCTVSEVQPEIFSEITLLTLPATRWHSPSVIQLHQVSGMPATNSRAFDVNNDLEILQISTD